MARASKNSAASATIGNMTESGRPRAPLELGRTYQLALDHNLEVIPVINKIDVASADVEGTKHSISEVLQLEADEALPISAKEGKGVPAVLEAIIARVASAGPVLVISTNATNW